MLTHLTRNLLFTLVAGVAACARGPAPIPVEPGVNFAAHPVRSQLVLDRLPDGGTGLLEPAGWLRAPGTPAYRLVRDGDTRAGLWTYGQSRVLVRRDASTLAEPAGEVLADWTANTIRLRLLLPDGRQLASDAFAREGGGTGPSTLSRTAQTVIDVRGTYRAPLRDPAGTEVGWLRVRVGPYQGPPRRYDGVVPAGVDGALAAAAAVLLDGEVTWIESHAEDVYRNQGGGPLERSVIQW
jgi:hypothetical protein